MNRAHYDPAGHAHFSHEEFERIGLRSTDREPLHVYCRKCGTEIDPLKPKLWGPRGWWECPRGCNTVVH